MQLGDAFKYYIIYLSLTFSKFHHVTCQFSLPIEDFSRTMCPPKHEKCSDGSTHFLCDDYSYISKKCKNYEEIIMTDGIKKQLLDGHNGIRNKVANDFNVANMNLLYWSRELESVARNYLKQCKIQHDTCNYIGINNLEVNTNILYRERHLIDRWPARAVRTWYLELGPDVTTGREFIEKKSHNISYAVNFTQMVWPQSEFIGCSAAKMFNGYFLVCYYYPRYQYHYLKMHLFIGSGCSKCPRFRPSCSRIFNGLCGIDLEMDSAEKLTTNKLLYTILLVIFWSL